MIDLEAAPRSVHIDGRVPRQLAEELTDLRTVDVSTSQQIGYLLLNKHLLGEASAVVAIGAYMGDLTTDDRAWEGANLATLDRPILMIDMPGHGLSSPHTPAQTIDLCFRRSANMQVEPIVEAVQKVLPSDNDPIDYFGLSQGGYLALKATELDPGDRVNTVFGVEIPAVKTRSTIGLQIGYVAVDNLINRRRYLDQLEGTVFANDLDEFKEMRKELEVPRAKSFVRNNPGLFMLNLLASYNARPGALDAWQSILETKKSTSVPITTSENGTVSDPDAIASFIEDLPTGQKQRSNQRILKGGDHNATITHLAPRAVEWAREAYTEHS